MCLFAIKIIDRFKPEHKMFGLQVIRIVLVNFQGFEAALNKVVQAEGEPDSTG